MTERVPDAILITCATQRKGKAMVTLHPSVLERDGKKAFVVLAYEESLLVEELLQEYQDLQALRAAKAKEATAPTVSLAQARRKLGV